MNVRQSVRQYAARQAVQRLLPLLARRRDETLIALTQVLERVASDPVHKVQMQKLRELFQQQHPALELARRVFTRAHPNIRRNLLSNLVLNAMYFSGEIRRARAQQGLAAPFTLVISPTMRCNLRCYGCYAGEYRKEDDLPFEVLDRIVTEAKALGTYFFTISGGEPFIIKDQLFELFRRHPDACFQIYTNGTLITQEVAEELVAIGNAGPAISVEGFEEETDGRRGKGTFAKIMQAMDHLREAGAIFGFSGTVTRHNVEILGSEEFVDFLIEKGCMFGWYFLYMPVGRAPQPELMPTPGQRRWLLHRTNHFRNTKPIFIADFWNDARLVGGCMSGGRLYAHINNKGDLEPCVFVHFAVDNLKEKSLAEALESPFFRAIRKRFPWSDNMCTPCMIIDHPCILREALAEGQAHPTHEGAESIIKELVPVLDRYAEEINRLAEPYRGTYGRHLWDVLLEAAGQQPADEETG